MSDIAVKNTDRISISLRLWRQDEMLIALITRLGGKKKNRADEAVLLISSRVYVRAYSVSLAHD